MFPEDPVSNQALAPRRLLDILSGMTERFVARQHPLAMVGVWLLATWVALAAASDPGLESAGNTDGVLTWQVTSLEPGNSARVIVLFVFDSSPETAAQRLAATRAAFAKPTMPGPADVSTPVPSKVWIRNETTDFALEGAGFFRWRLQRQSLAGPQGGQLSQFAWYVHYEDATGSHRAGTINDGEPEVENLRLVEPVRSLGETQSVCVVETADAKLRLRVRPMMGQGSAVAVEFVLSNRQRLALQNLRLSVYANIEAAHTHEGDYSLLDARTGGLLVLDPATSMTVIMAGLADPVSGYSGVWNSMPKAQLAENSILRCARSSGASSSRILWWTSGECFLSTNPCLVDGSIRSTRRFIAWASRPHLAGGCWCWKGCTLVVRSGSSGRTSLAVSGGPISRSMPGALFSASRHMTKRVFTSTR
jgi:hypothetical protein